MALVKSASLIIYRFAEKGLEVFLLNSKEAENWALPQGETPDEETKEVSPVEHIIALDPVKQEDGVVEQGFAVEGDWHDIPSLKSMLMEDVHFVKDQFKQMVPDMMEKGTYVAVKEAFKRVLPHQYEMLKELKDILIDRNSVGNI